MYSGDKERKCKLFRTRMAAAGITGAFSFRTNIFLIATSVPAVGLEVMVTRN